MKNFRKLDSILRNQASGIGSQRLHDRVLAYAETLADLENVIVVVSDIGGGKSRIFAGNFAERLGIGDYSVEESIWEKNILSLLSDEEKDDKFVAELRFLNYIRHLSAKQRRQYYLMTKLRFLNRQGMKIDVLHRMFYVYGDDGVSVMYAICSYGPLVCDFHGKSVVVNSVTSVVEELSSLSDNDILSRRERQVLSLIDEGKTSEAIAGILSISKHTVSRHRQGILSKLQAKNSTEACRIAKSLGII